MGGNPLNIRKAGQDDLSRIAEIFVFNNRVNYFPIFKDEEFSFGELQVVSLVNGYFGRDDVREHLYVCEDKVIKGFLQVNGKEICKLYVDTFFQSQGIGGALIEFGVRELHGGYLWALEKNVRAVSFYQPKEDIGRLAMELLDKKINGIDTGYESIFLEHELRIRKSTVK